MFDSLSPSDYSLLHMIFRIFVASLLAVFSSSLWADYALNLKSQNRVKILKVVVGFETEIIEEIRQGKLIESCMKIASAHAASVDLKVLVEEDLSQLESHLGKARSNCSDLDIVKVDELYLKQMSRHLLAARQEFEKL